MEARLCSPPEIPWLIGEHSDLPKLHLSMKPEFWDMCGCIHSRGMLRITGLAPMAFLPNHPHWAGTALGGWLQRLGLRASGVLVIVGLKAWLLARRAPLSP